MTAPEPSPAPLPSALDAAARRVGDRWSLLLVAALMDGSRRFTELQEAVDGIAPNILSRRLTHLEEGRVIVAHRYSERPPRYEYGLTAAGRELADAIRMLADWGGRELPEATGGEAEPLRHAACGTPAEARWWCPTCGRPIEDGETDDYHHL